MHDGWFSQPVICIISGNFIRTLCLQKVFKLWIQKYDQNLSLVFSCGVTSCNVCCINFSRVKVFAENQYKTLFSSIALGEAAGKRYTTLFTPGQRRTRKLQGVSTRLSINQLETQNEQFPHSTAIDQEEVNKL